MAWSRSACCPVRPNRPASALPRLDSITGRSGSPGGTASAASDSRVMAWSRSACCPVRPNRARQRVAEVGQHRRPVGVAGRGGVGRLGQSGDGLVQVRLLPGAPEPAPQRDRRGSAQITGRSGWSAGMAFGRLLAGGDGLVQVRLLPGAPEPGPQRGPEVGQVRRAGPAWSVGVASTASRRIG